MKIVVLDGFTLNPGDLSWAKLEKLGTVTVYDRSSPEHVVSRIGDATLIFTNKTELTKEVLSQCPSVKFIGVLATGYNVVDLEAAKAQGIVVSNVPTYGTATVAQFATSLLLELCNHVGLHSVDVKQGAWGNCPDFCYWLKPMIELDGKNVGIIGFGKIGQAFGRIAQALGMQVLAYDDYKNPALESETVKYVDLDTLFRQSDVISLHCVLNNQTKAIINTDNLNKMKPTALLVNASRGPLVNEHDLAQALNRGQIAGAAVDVLSEEPARTNNPLLQAKNCYITPHIAWASLEARGRIMQTAIDNAQAFLSGHPQNRVDNK